MRSFFGDPFEPDWNKTRDDAPIDMSIVDLVAGPKGLKPGPYILQYRNDCEQHNLAYGSSA